MNNSSTVAHARGGLHREDERARAPRPRAQAIPGILAAALALGVDIGDGRIELPRPAEVARRLGRDPRDGAVYRAFRAARAQGIAVRSGGGGHIVTLHQADLIEQRAQARRGAFSVITPTTDGAEPADLADERSRNLAAAHIAWLATYVEGAVGRDLNETAVGLGDLVARIARLDRAPGSREAARSTVVSECERSSNSLTDSQLSASRDAGSREGARCFPDTRDWTDAELDVILQPLTDLCRRSGVPGVTNREQVIAALAPYSRDAICHAERLICAQARQSSIRSPIGLLVSLAREHRHEYFSVPEAVSQRGVAPEGSVVEESPDPRAVRSSLAEARSALSSGKQAGSAR